MGRRLVCLGGDQPPLDLDPESLDPSVERSAGYAQPLSGLRDAPFLSQHRPNLGGVRFDVSCHGRIVSHRGQGVKGFVPTPRHSRATLPRMPAPELRQAISREVKRALSDARLSAAAAAKKMPKDEKGRQPQAKLIYRWIKGDVTAPLERLEEFALAVEQPLRLYIGPEIAKEPPPEWAEAMVERVPQIMTKAEVETYVDGVKGEVLDAITDANKTMNRFSGLLEDFAKRLSQFPPRPDDTGRESETPQDPDRRANPAPQETS